ncbi:MAG: Holliday junction branch migration protein RuvA [Anaerovoracaceae bacterium]
MLHYIKGKLAMKFDGGIVIEAGGLGYEVYVPNNSAVYLEDEGQDIIVFTAMIVREDDISLYGFNQKEELDIFKKLITVSGVGAKAALAILSAIPLHEVVQAIAFEDVNTLTKANGIGKKTAQRIVLDLKDKFGNMDTATLPEGFTPSGDMSIGSDQLGQAISGLIALGYTKAESINAMATIKDKDLTAEEYIRHALKKLF